MKGKQNTAGDVKEERLATSIVSVNDSEECCFRRGFQHGAKAMLSAMEGGRFSRAELHAWIDTRVAQWRFGRRSRRTEPPGPDGQPWPQLYEDE
jgi:hypothetical protein